MIGQQLGSQTAVREMGSMLRLIGGGEVHADFPAITDRRVGLSESINALGLFSALIAALTAGAVIGSGYAYSDVVVLLSVQLASAVAIWKVPWRTASEVWLLAIIGLQVFFVACLIALTGGSASPYFALYAPVLALAGWHLRLAPLAIAVGIVAATELWRALLIDVTVRIEPLAVSLLVYGLLAALAWLMAQRSTISLVRNRRDQVRTAATLNAIRTLSERGADDPLEDLAELAAGVLDAQASLATAESGPAADGHACPGDRAAHISFPVSAVGAEFGELNLCREEPFSTSELRLASILADAIGRTLENRRLFEEVRGESMRDHLTGLLNRRAFDADIERFAAESRSGGSDLTLFFLDVDGFKRLNDRHGHAEGDLVLQRIARALIAQARAVDRVYRYGGDEFVVLVRDADAETAVGMAKRLRAATVASRRARVSDTVSNGGRVVAHVSVGFASCHGDACSAQSLVAEADRAMYAEKTAKRFNEATA